ncbi:ABC transporter ATP-binding protein [Flavobacterium sp.]|uniref:ABC transporter ATP-binding protein n=1 Tax=Flavobacterium sp. TaxID=239 RepID=UPI0033406D2B
MLKVSSISFSYQNEPTLKTIDFSIPQGSCHAIIGESGCGKSTLLKAIYGLYDLDEGQIFWNEIEILGPKYHLIPGMEFMKYLAQDFDLMPYITVAENVGKYLSNFYPDQKQERIFELLDIVEMSEYAHVKAKYLSGGQMQRVALARVLAKEPEVLLLDEPFSHIDNFRKNSLRRKLFYYLKKQGITTLIATHDTTDVLSYADSVLVMKDGNAIAQGPPKELYHTSDLYVASLFEEVSVLDREGQTHHVYPHQVQISSKGIPAQVEQSYFKGSHYLLALRMGSALVYGIHFEPIAEGSHVFVQITSR